LGRCTNFHLKGWIEKGESDGVTYYKTSPVVQEIVRRKNAGLRAACKVLIDALNEKLDYEAGIGHFLNATYAEALHFVRYAEAVFANFTSACTISAVFVCGEGRTGRVGIALKQLPTMIPDIDHYYLNKTEPTQSCLLALRNIILRQDPNITETQKYGMPCFCYQKKICCYLWTDKKTDHPYLLMVKGKHLVRPELEAGKRSRMKIFRVDPNQDLPIKTIEAILQQSLDLYRTGI
jgi:hypothetical protein